MRIDWDDVIEKFIRSSTPGGSNANKVSTCVYLRHVPTGIEVKCDQERKQALNRQIARERLEAKVGAYFAAELARAHGLTPTQLALSFVYHRWFVTSTIIGATNMNQLKENIAAWDTQLSPEVMLEIEDLHLRMMNPAP